MPNMRLRQLGYALATVVIVLSVAALLTYKYAGNYLFSSVPDAVVMELALAESPELLEGLPHHSMERRLFEPELAKHNTIDLLGYKFYDDVRKMPLDVRDELATRLIKPGSLRAFGGEKTCGGFHPDYAVRWSAGGQEFLILFCFGCHEIKTVGKTGDKRYDMGTSTELLALLKPYRKHRPDSLLLRD